MWAPQAQDWPARDRGGSASAEPPLVEDSGFAQLVEYARDPERMREVLQRHLRPLDKGTYRVRECEVSHVCYRHATHYVVLYTLRLGEPDTGQEWSQRVSGVIQAGNKSRWIWERLRRSSSASEVSDVSSIFEPFSYIPDLDMLAQAFPYDHQLPALPLLMAGSPPEREPLLLARFGTGDWQAKEWDVEVVRYLASLRATLRLTVRVQPRRHAAPPRPLPRACTDRSARAFAEEYS